jgi:uncharacterized protein (TIGR02611 family)
MSDPVSEDPKQHHHWPIDDVWGDEQSEIDAEAVVAELEVSEPELARRWHDHPTLVPFKAVARFIRKSGKRIAVTFAGSVVVIIGLILVPLPGPGWAIVFGGLAILATEYVWARRLLNFAKEKVGEAVDVVTRKNNKNKDDSETDPPA